MALRRDEPKRAVTPTANADSFDYPLWLVLALGAGYLFAGWTLWIQQLSHVPGELVQVGIFVWFLVTVIVLTLDRSAFITLRGRLTERRPHPLISPLLVLVGIPLSIIWLLPYLIIAGVDAIRGPRVGALDQQHRIALLEGQLGLQPTTGGSCFACAKPLQDWAEFCAYCGTQVSASLQVCGACGERTFPDANWCPACGLPLPPLGRL